jgi:membrane-bound lytic murein transglycosylase D
MKQLACVAMLVGILFGTTLSAYAHPAQDRRVSMFDAMTMAEIAQQGAEFPMAVNDLVLKQLNRFIGTPQGRGSMRDALARMQSYKATIGHFLQKHGIPMEIIAVPIIESGYRNLTEQQTGTPMRTAGLWQFIPTTARNFGLTVNADRDDRLDVGLSTEAALRYLHLTNLRFKDWHLSAMAYNMGEAALQKGINVLGSRDPWALIRNGFEGDKDYLPKLMAAILILKNPETIR